ncbi:MAG: 1-deoxy-D-xylulose-5-phosphate reductoisomerase [Defluviitaleaceae bacterium]|nr:1-deoxy-D-xylulose-5-phosphate reductoisomerase [Defluviitaleaceae bacterium]
MRAFGVRNSTPGVKDIVLLGATGSIGTQTLDVVRRCLPNAKVRALTGYGNVSKLTELVNEFKPDMVCVKDEKTADDLKKSLVPDFGTSLRIVTGDEGLIACAAEEHSAVVVNALVGRAGLAPTLAAIRAGKHVALANKESLVTAGALIMGEAREKGVRIMPIDSEHSAIWQCLQGNEGNEIEKIILTASGGPFRTWPSAKINKATAEDALKHPNWHMGPKITIDSATLMNKGLEYIEALHLFNVKPEQIEIVIHPQSIIHSMVQFTDGSVMAQMGLPDMRLPILYALTAPHRVKTDFPRLDLLKHKTLTFRKPNEKKFPCLAIAKEAAAIGGTAPAVMNAVNEWAVGRFLSGRIRFTDIAAIISRALKEYTVKPLKCAEDVWEAEKWAGELVEACQL